MREVAIERNDTRAAAQPHAAPPINLAKPTPVEAAHQQPDAIAGKKSIPDLRPSDRGQSSYGTHSGDATVGEIHAPIYAPKTGLRLAHDEPEAGTNRGSEAQTECAPDLRFSDPLISEIVETWRLRQDMVRAQTKLTLQIKSICRRFTAGDKAEAEKLHASIGNGMSHPKAEACFIACLPLIEAKKPIEASRKSLEKHLTKLGKQLPVAHMADDIKGVGHLALAKIVGECGDLSAYKSVSAVWKRAGLAVIDGGRQRRVTGESALAHGYSPERRSTFWNIAAALIKAQGKGDDAGPYRRYYDEEKERQVANGITLGHAHNRAMRHMTKKLLKDITVEWRKLAKAD